MGEDIVPKLGDRVVADQLQEAELVVHDEEEGFVFVEALEAEGCCRGLVLAG